VGTRGRSLGGLQGLLPGSVSKYCLQHSPVPVIVVRPTSKREKKKKKRQANPNRRGYLDILEKSSGGSRKAGHVLDQSSRNSIASEQPSAGEGEALAVAEAVGLNPRIEAALEAAQAAHAAKIEALESSATPSPTDSPMDESKDSEVVMKSPDPEDFESPDSSESDDDGEGEFEAQSGDLLVGDMDIEEPEGHTDLDKNASAPSGATEKKGVPTSTD
jgi:Universal stress protein family